MPLKLLFLAHEPPYPPDDGGRIRNYHLLKELSARHAVTLVTFAARHDAEKRLQPLRALCHQVVAVPPPERPARTVRHKLRDLARRTPIGLHRLASPEMWATLAQLAGRNLFDVVHANHLLVAGYVAILAGLPAVLSHENVEAEAQRRQRALERRLTSLHWWLSLLEQRRWRHYEIDISRRFDALTAVSQRDARYFRRHLPGMPVVVVPNGVDTTLLRPPERKSGIERDAPLVLYTGSMDYPPNADAVTWFARTIWPQVQRQEPVARFLVVGRDPGPDVRALAALPGITVTGTVPDVRPYFEKAAVYVAPLRSGSGTRLKILEAMATGLPIVSTSLGCEGLDVAPGRDLLVADEPAEFASAVIGLLANRDACACLGLQARRTAEQRYGWDAIVREQERAYELAIARQS